MAGLPAYPIAAAPARPGRPRRHRRAGGGGAWRGRRRGGDRRARRGRAQRRLRRGRRGGQGRGSENSSTLARRHGIRLVGPNCLGVLNTDPAVRLNASFAPAAPPAGGLAVASQSGAVGIALLDHAARTGCGVSTFVSLGNKADVSGNDLIAYWFDDPATTRWRSTSSRSATRAGSPGPCGRWPAASRCSPSRADGRRPGSAPAPRTPPRQRPRTSRSTRCSRRPA